MSVVGHQAACVHFPYAKYFCLVRELVKYNNDLATGRMFEFLTEMTTETFLGMLQNSAPVASNMLQVVLTEEKTKEMPAVTVPEMWQSMSKVLFEVFVETSKMAKKRS